MDEKQIIEHVKRKYSTGKERANFLLETVHHRRNLISEETASAIIEILNRPICTGVIFGQLADNYYHYLAENYNCRKKSYKGDEVR